MVSTANATSTGDFTKNNFKFSAPSTKVPGFSQELSTVNQSSSNTVKCSIIITKRRILLYKHMYPAALYIFLNFVVWKFWKLFGSNVSSFQFIRGELGPTTPKRNESFLEHTLTNIIAVLVSCLTNLQFYLQKKNLSLSAQSHKFANFLKPKKFFPMCVNVILKGTHTFWKIFSQKLCFSKNLLLVKTTGFFLIILCWFFFLLDYICL